MIYRIGRWFYLVALAVCLCAPAFAEEAPGRAVGDPEKAAVQHRIESGEDLSARGQKVLFRCRTQQDEGNYDRAVEIMTAWLDDHPDREHSLLLYNLAVSRSELGDNAGAYAALEKAVELEPDFSRAWLRLGETAFAVQKYDTAAEAFARAHELAAAATPEMLYYSGVAWVQAEQPDRAVNTLTTLLDAHRPGADLDWYQALIAAAVDTDRPERAEPYLDNLLADHSAEPAAWELAYQYAAYRQNYRLAATYLTVAGYLRPLTVSEMDQLGDLYSVINVPLVAARYYERALAATEVRVSETEAPARRYERLASAWLAAHRRDEARTALEAGLTVRDDAGLWSLLGDLEYMEQDYTGARTAFAHSCSLDPQNGRGWLMQGFCAIEQGDKAAAGVFLRRAAEFPEQAETASRLMGQIN